jgi:curved DNA-binding protein CbpA
LNQSSRSEYDAAERVRLPDHNHYFALDEPDHYAVLGVRLDAPASTIESAFKKLRKRYHPDVNIACDAVQKYARLKLACDTLLDAEARKAFDSAQVKQQQQQQQQRGRQGPPTPSQQPQQHAEWSALPKYNHEVDVMEQSHYKVLGIHPKASAATIERAFRSLRLRFHPDVSDAADAVGKYMRLREAYSILIDEVSGLPFSCFLSLTLTLSLALITHTITSHWIEQDSRAFYDSLLLKTSMDSSSQSSKSTSEKELHDFSVLEVDHYKVLGLPPDCTKQEIKKSYLSLSRRLHPDKNRAPDAKEKFQRLGFAFSTLQDEVRVQTVFVVPFMSIDLLSVCVNVTLFYLFVAEWTNGLRSQASSLRNTNYRSCLVLLLVRVCA